MKQTEVATNPIVEARLNYKLVKAGNPQILIDPDGEAGKRIDPDYDSAVV